MIEAFKRLFRRDEAKARTRALDAASVGRRLSDAGRITNLNADIYHGGSTIRARAAHATMNDAWVSAAVSAFVGSAVGTGVEPTPRTDDDALRRLIADRWRAWVDVADLSEQMDFAGVTAGAVRSVAVAGEAFVRMVVTDAGMRLQPVPPSMVPLDLHSNLAGGGRVRAGIEFDAIGRKVAVHVYASEPGDPLDVVSLTPIRVPYDDIAHVYEGAPIQVRGIPRIATVLLRAHDLNAYEDATLVRQKIGNAFAGFVRDVDGSNAGLNDAVEQDGNLTLETGTLLPLPPGTDITFSDPPDPAATYSDYVRNHLRAIASGVGVTYEQVSADFSNTNYSSARAALIEHRRKTEQFQYLTLVPMFLNKVWRRWIAVEVLLGNLPASAADIGADWLMPRFENADPKAAVEAEVAEITNGLKSRSQAVAERGWRVDDLDQQIAADRERERRLGLAFGAPTNGAAQQNGLPGNVTELKQEAPTP